MPAFLNGKFLQKSKGTIKNDICYIEICTFVDIFVK